jgi:phenylacetate-CoA ligase
MDAHGIRPGNILSLKDLRRFPLLTKQTIRDRREEMVWKDEGSRVRIARTSGSTNAALDFYTSSSREAHITAARMRGHKWVGVDPGDKEMYFWAAPVELKAQDRVKRIRDFLRNDGFTDALDITPQAVARNLEMWKRWRPKCIFGYVSSFTLMARMAAEAGLDLTVPRDRGLRAIVTTSEILGENRQIIEDAFGVPAYDSYGIRETGLIGHECQHQTMHTNDEQLILEVLDRQTLEPTDGEGELVATALISRVMPVIRYRTGDVVTLSNRPCPCGRTLASGRVTGGRLLEFIVTTEGRWVSAVAFIYVCRKIKEVLQVQARQERLGEVRVLVVPDKGFPSDGVDRVREAVRERMGGKDEIKVELVAEIPASPSGKQKLVVGKVAERLLAEGGGLALRASGGRLSAAGANVAMDNERW